MARAADKHHDATPPRPAERRLRTVANFFADPSTSDVDRLIYERIRLGILSALSVNTSMSFGELKALLNTSDGNLSTHARRLEEAGYLSCKKRFSGRVPKTEYALTPRGRRVFARHLEHLESLIQAAKG